MMNSRESTYVIVPPKVKSESSNSQAKGLDFDEPLENGVYRVPKKLIFQVKGQRRTKIFQEYQGKGK